MLHTKPDFVFTLSLENFYFVRQKITAQFFFGYFVQLASSSCTHMFKIPTCTSRENCRTKAKYSLQLSPVYDDEEITSFRFFFLAARTCYIVCVSRDFTHREKKIWYVSHVRHLCALLLITHMHSTRAPPVLCVQRLYVAKPLLPCGPHVFYITEHVWVLMWWFLMCVKCYRCVQYIFDVLFVCMGLLSKARLYAGAFMYFCATPIIRKYVMMFPRQNWQVISYKMIIKY